MFPQRMVRRHPRLGLLVTLVVLALSACGGEKQQEFKPQPLPEEQQELRPGTYGSEEFKPSLSFRVGEGWANLLQEGYDHLALTWRDTGDLHFVTARRVYEPTKKGAPNAVEAPEDLVGWFRQHPLLQTDKPKQVTVGGIEGERFDVVVREVPEGYYGACGSDCVDIFRVSEASTVWLPKGYKARVIVLEDVKGETVTIGVGSPANEFDEFAPEAQKVIDSMEWTGS
jgi:hypothetical protein